MTPTLLTPEVPGDQVRPAQAPRACWRGREEFSMMRGGNENCQAKLFVREVSEAKLFVREVMSRGDP
jgi:hypothetical protein